MDYLVKRLFHDAHLNDAVALQKRLEKCHTLLEAKDGQGLTVFFWATCFGNGPLMQWLVEHGADLQTTNNAGWTPLHWAAHVGRAQTITLLCHLGANVNALTPQRQTPLHLAAARGHYQPVRDLVNEGALLLATDRQGKTPAQCAQANGHANCAQFLHRRLQQLQHCWQHFAAQCPQPSMEIEQKERKEKDAIDQTVQLMTQKFMR